MPFCPNCKMEYREGFKVCADCKVPLVDKLEEMPKFEEIDESNLFVGDFATDEDDNDIPESMEKYVMEDEDGIKRVDETALIEAINTGEFTELGDIDDNMLRRIAPQIQGVLRRQKALSSADVYVPSKEKMSELSSSIVTLFICGGIGLIAVILALFGVIPLPIHGVRLYVICGVMCVMFLAFIVGGFTSIASKKKLSSAVDDEEENMKKLIFYIENNFDAKAVDDHIGDIDEGQKFFVRTAYLRRDLKEMFPDLSDGFIDNFIDENFDKIFD